MLSTQYRRPIEFTDDALTAAKKGLSVFARLFERIERMGKPVAPNLPDVESVAATLMESEHGHFVRDVLNLKIKFLEMMDDDFNTAGAIAVLHELAGEVNSFIERYELEKTRAEELLTAAAAATVTLRKLGGLLNLFRGGTNGATKKKDDSLTDQLMQLMIQFRADARKSKNFALADGIRDGLAKIGVTLEDRSDGTVWRKD